MRPAAEPTARSQPTPRGSYALRLSIALLVALRLAYHLLYLVRDPFALATFSDGQLYEDAARDILAHPPFGSQPFYLQGLYAYVLALPMALAPQVVIGLLLQLALAAGALVWFHRTAVAQLGALNGALSSACLLAFSELAFYENKYLSVSFGVVCNVLALWAACRAVREPSFRRVLAAGAAAGLATLGRPNMVLALPATLLALLIASWPPAPAAKDIAPRSDDAMPALAAKQALGRVLLAFGLGVALALAPMALRNAVVLGRAEVFPSHAGAIPFYIGNNPHANGRWNTAGGLLTGQVGLERVELGARLGLKIADPAELDRAIGSALLDRAFAYIRADPGGWFGLELKKLWYTLGNHRFVRDYDLRGEAELLGTPVTLGLPFGVLLALATLGLATRAQHAAPILDPRAQAQARAVSIVVLGQAAAVLCASLFAFASAQNRVPLAISLAWFAGPGLHRLYVVFVGEHGHDATNPDSVAAPRPWLALGLALALGVQAFWPRLQASEQPSSFHYFNLAAVEEAIGRDEAAATHYRRAAERNPKEPMFHLREAFVARRLGRMRSAAAALDRLERLPDVPVALQRAAAAERARLPAP